MLFVVFATLFFSHDFLCTTMHYILALRRGGKRWTSGADSTKRTSSLKWTELTCARRAASYRLPQAVQTTPKGHENNTKRTCRNSGKKSLLIASSSQSVSRSPFTLRFLPGARHVHGHTPSFFRLSSLLCCGIFDTASYFGFLAIEGFNALLTVLMKKSLIASAVVSVSTRWSFSNCSHQAPIR